ncbi:MAG TPA: protein kinase, partial [bacterium]|nr:protein kinase [bacterium]
MAIGIGSIAASADFQVGDRIGGRYLIEEIRRGNMGIVYLASDLDTSQPIALKTLETRYLDSQRNRDAFMREASTWIQLERHPNIVQAYSLQQFGSQPYLLLERILTRNLRGSTLKDLIFTEPVSIQRMIQIGIHICDGMIH